jgi:hypothetical protein
MLEVAVVVLVVLCQAVLVGQVVEVLGRLLG